MIKKNRARPIGIDLFAGAGGLSLGFEKAGFDVVGAVELDPIHCAVHAFNFPNCRIICADVRTLSGSYIREQFDLEAQEIDVVFGGAPCQGFSMIGKREAKDPRNELIRQFVRLVADLRPKYFVLENVQGLALGDARRILEKAIEEFRKHKYLVRHDFKILNAADFGVPQDRRRLFLIGCREDQRLPNYPEPTHTPATAPRKTSAGLSPGPSVWQAIGDLPDVDDFEELLKRDWTNVKYRKQSNYVKDLNGNNLDFAYPRFYQPEILSCSRRTSHNSSSRRRFENTESGQVEPISRFLRLDPNGVCNTLRAGTANDRGAFSSPRPIHCFLPRCITVREAARLHSFPDWFRFHSTKWHGMRQVGNSVPPYLGYAVAREIIKSMGLQPSRPKHPINLGDPVLLTLNRTQAASHFEVDCTPSRAECRKRSLSSLNLPRL